MQDPWVPQGRRSSGCIEGWEQRKAVVDEFVAVGDQHSGARCERGALAREAVVVAIGNLEGREASEAPILVTLLSGLGEAFVRPDMVLTSIGTTRMPRTMASKPGARRHGYRTPLVGEAADDVSTRSRRERRGDSRVSARTRPPDLDHARRGLTR